MWRIVRRTGVYEKDRLDPVDPRGVPEHILAGMEHSPYPETAKHLCYLQELSGRPAMTDIISVYSAEEAALRETGKTWLAGG